MTATTLEVPNIIQDPEMERILLGLKFHPLQVEERRERFQLRIPEYLENRKAEERERARVNRSAMALFDQPGAKLSPLAWQLIDSLGICAQPPEVFGAVWKLTGKRTGEVEVRCEVCRKPFKAKRRSARYCADKCRARAARNRA